MAEYFEMTEDFPFEKFLEKVPELGITIELDPTDKTSVFLVLGDNRLQAFTGDGTVVAFCRWGGCDASDILAVLRQHFGEILSESEYLDEEEEDPGTGQIQTQTQTHTYEITIDDTTIIVTSVEEKTEQHRNKPKWNEVGF